MQKQMQKCKQLTKKHSGGSHRHSQSSYNAPLMRDIKGARKLKPAELLTLFLALSSYVANGEDDALQGLASNPELIEHYEKLKKFGECHLKQRPTGTHRHSSTMNHSSHSSRATRANHSHSSKSRSRR